MTETTAAARHGALDGQCSCETWGLLDRVRRDLVLAGFMEWAWLFHKVSLKLLARGDHVAVCELVALKPGIGKARLVMTELCAWADCARVTLELTPSAHWGADVVRLAKFYGSLGFVAKGEAKQPLSVQEDMIRYLKAPMMASKIRATQASAIRYNLAGLRSEVEPR